MSFMTFALIILISPVIQGQSCSSGSIENSPLKEKINKLVQLIDKLECLKKPKKTLSDFVLDPDQFKGQDEVCGKRFETKQSTPMVHCLLSTKQMPKMKAKNFDANLCTHVELIGGYCLMSLTFGHFMLKVFPEDFEYLVAYLKKVQVPVILGFGKDDGITTKLYSAMASNEEKRSNFVESVLSIINQYDLGGFFVLWEYPTFWDYDVYKKHPEDAEGFFSLVKALSDKLKEKSRILIAAAPNTAHFSNYFDLPRLENIIDFWMMHLYLWEGPWSYKTAISSSMRKLEEILSLYVKQIKPEKLLLGIPSHYEPVILAKKDAGSLGALLKSSKLNSERFKGFREICEEIGNGGVKVMHNETGLLGSYAFKNTDWVSFDASFLIRKKVELVKKKNIRGMFLSSVGFDDFDGKACKCGRFPLLRAINEALRGDGTCVVPNCPT